MKHDPIAPANPDAWIDQTFDNPGVRNGRMFRIPLRSVEASVGMARFKQELIRRNYRALENNGVVVVFCNTEPVEILVSGGRSGADP